MLFIIAAVVVFGAYYIVKDVPGGVARKYTPNSFRSKPWAGA